MANEDELGIDLLDYSSIKSAIEMFVKISPKNYRLRGVLKVHVRYKRR